MASKSQHPLSAEALRAIDNMDLEPDMDVRDGRTRIVKPIPPEPKGELSQEENKLMAVLEARIDYSQNQFKTVLNSLVAIARHRLWRDGNKNFTEYCETHWNLTGQIVRTIASIAEQERV